MVSPLKKKRKVTTVQMKAALTTKQSTFLVPVTTTTRLNRPGHQRLSSLSPSLNSKTAAMSDPQQSKMHPPLSNASFFHRFVHVPKMLVTC